MRLESECYIPPPERPHAEPWAYGLIAAGGVAFTVVLLWVLAEFLS